MGKLKGGASNDCPHVSIHSKQVIVSDAIPFHSIPLDLRRRKVQEGKMNQQEKEHHERVKKFYDSWPDWKKEGHQIKVVNVTSCTCPMCGNEFFIKNTGDLMCGPCTQKTEVSEIRIKKLIQEGNPYHCANRQVYGDGECECDMYKSGYDPYSWVKRIEENI